MAGLLLHIFPLLIACFSVRGNVTACNPSAGVVIFRAIFVGLTAGILWHYSGLLPRAAEMISVSLWPKLTVLSISVMVSGSSR